MLTPPAHTDSLHDELAARLDASDARRASGAFRVEEVLKRSDAEETQLVYLRLCDGRELGPYVRKVIDAASGLGGAYPLLARAQRGGARFHQLPRIVDCREKGGRLEVVMEYVRGATLREVVERAGEGAVEMAAKARLTLAERLMPAVCDAVLELHECAEGPLVHRDLTPGNVLVPTADPLRPVLIDFGIARAWKDGARCDTTHFGTRAYAPPEQFGFGQTDVRTDVYALGMLAFFCLTGRDPEPSDREAGFAVSGVPGRWQEVVRAATALDPQERFAGVGELRAAIVAAAAGEGAAAKPVALPFGRGLLPSVAVPTPLLAGWNAVVAAAALLCCAASASLVFDERAMSGNAPAFRGFGYVVWMPCGLLLLGYLLLSKRRLRAKVTFFRNRTPGQVWKLFLLIYLAVTVVWLALLAV